MKKIANITYEHNVFHVSGQLCVGNVMVIYRKSLPQLLRCPEWAIDFSGVTSSDSSGLALAIEWIKLAKQQGKKISFQSIPREMLAIAKAADIDTILLPPKLPH